METQSKKEGLLQLQKEFLSRYEFYHFFAYSPDESRKYPIYVDENDTEWWDGEVVLAMPNDTHIRELKDGKFEITEYHHKDENIILDSIEDVINYYHAYVVVLFDIDTFDEMPLSFRKAYKLHLIRKSSIINVKDEEVIDKYNKHK